MGRSGRILCLQFHVFMLWYGNRKQDEEGFATMGNRVAVIAVIIEQVEKANEVNAVLHDYNELIIGRMGLPYRTRNVYIINIVVDASMDQINAIAGKLGGIAGVTAKAVYSSSI